MEQPGISTGLKRITAFYIGVLIVQLGWVAVYADFKNALFLFPLGIISWSVLEYFLHRFPLHMKAHGRTLYNRLAAVPHATHHQKPNDKDEIVSPLRTSVPIYVLILGAYRLFTGSWGDGLLLGSSLVLTYMAYEWLHYAAHHHTPRTALGRFYRRYHLLHHFKDPKKNFGVTSPVWDFVFRTQRLE